MKNKSIKQWKSWNFSQKKAEVNNMKEFEESNYRKFSDPNNIMSELFSVACSLCGYEEISFVAENTPESIGDIAKRAYDENPDMSDEEMDALMDGPIDA
ncbi:hypothetical protein Zmor_012160 [Zophobas morio]|uniref:Uncharacterized protein n=1 Tax=Zophobas morio TaxID=2755281 RepID=A0AA38HIZ9_9CUCU|nr:hypothetical protein Zmor_012160 [Zophobas morio]